MQESMGRKKGWREGAAEGVHRCIIYVYVYVYVHVYVYVYAYRVCKSLRFVTAASKDWGSGFGLVTAGRERAKRAPDLWLPPQTLNPNLCERAKEHASRAGEHGIIELLQPHCVSVI